MTSLGAQFYILLFLAILFAWVGRWGVALVLGAVVALRAGVVLYTDRKTKAQEK